MDNIELKFLDIDNVLQDRRVWEKLISERSENLHRCQFIGNEVACPKFQLIDENDQDNECSFGLRNFSDPFCELLPIEEVNDA